MRQNVNVAMAGSAPAPNRPPPPAPADAAALFADTSAVVPKNGAVAEAAEGALRSSGYRPTVAVTPPSEIYGDEAPPSDALPSFGGATMTADELLANEEFEAAVQEYEVALVLLDDPSERAAALARLSRALLGLGRKTEAEARCREATEAQPRHPDVLCTRAELDAAGEDMTALLASAEAWLMRAPEHPRAIELLGKAADATGDVRRTIDARRRLARVSMSAPERAEVFLECSGRAEAELPDEALALSLALEGLELSPSHLGLLDRTRDLLERAGRRHELLAYYERAMSQILDPDTATAVSERIERLAGEPDADPKVAAAALDRLIERRPTEPSLRLRVAELHAAVDDLPRAIQQCRAAVKVAPQSAECYRRLRGYFERAGNADGAFGACSVLESLGEADLDESLLANQHRPEGLLPVRGVVADADWNESLFPEDGERDLLELFGALAFLGPVASRVGIAYLKDKKRDFSPDPATLQDTEKSTTMLAKTLGWSSRLLSLGVPELYVLPELPAGIDVAPLTNSAVLASRALGSGLELGELAFLWGRQLPRLRPELRALTFFRTRGELSSFLTALLALAGARGVDVKALDKDTKRLHGALKREMKGVDFSRLKAFARKIPAIELAGRVERLMRTTELTGVRAGLLLVGDVVKAAELIRRYPTEGLTKAEDQLAELYTFAVSEAYARLRQRLGIGV
jgi:tetratricopeptide (TPR) repeat protein